MMLSTLSTAYHIPCFYYSTLTSSKTKLKIFNTIKNGLHCLLSYHRNSLISLFLRSHLTLLLPSTKNISSFNISIFLTLLYLSLPFCTFLYLSLPFFIFLYLSLSFLTFPYLSLPSLTFLYVSQPYLTFLCLPSYFQHMLEVPRRPVDLLSDLTAIVTLNRTCEALFLSVEDHYHRVSF